LRVLSVGGGADRNFPRLYRGWQQEILDIDPAVKPDICCDALKMASLKANQYDAIYCSHNLEHFHKHEVPQVLAGFTHVLKPAGFAQIAVPDMAALFAAVVNGDIDDEWYRVSAGPITFHDVIYGWGRQIARGNDYYCHKTGFTERSLTRALKRAQFTTVLTATDGCNLHAYAFRQKPTKGKLASMGL
jgi:hypothetical protein